MTEREILTRIWWSVWLLGLMNLGALLLVAIAVFP